MMRGVWSLLYWLAGLTIGLGSLGHGIGGTRAMEQAVGATTLDPRWNEVIHVVWHFVTAMMVANGVIVLAGWFFARRGSRGSFVAPAIIAVLYLGFGLAASAYQHGERFWLLFAVQGIVLLAAIGGLSRPAARQS
jgi:F0F1-type ATP synthase membrane subunit c/vacuolar-type H+-ATPase subunit K